MRNVEGPLKDLTEGRHKKVKVDSERKVAISHYKEGKFNLTHRQVVGSFYLKKILNLLLPENIPSVRLATSINPRIEADFVEPDPRHKELQVLWEKNVKGKNLTNQEEEMAEFLQEHIRWNPRILRLRMRLAEFLTNYDSGAVNFGLNNKTGAAVYVENDINPWEINSEKKVEPNYLEKGILQASNKLDPDKREKMIAYLNRLKKLQAEEQEDLTSKK